MVKISNGTSSQYFALKSVNKLKKVYFESPSSLKFLGHYAFYKCNLLTEIDFSNCSSLENIGSFCFADCFSISRVVFPTQSKLEILDYACFYHLISVKSYTFPSSLRYINGETTEFGVFGFYNGDELRFNEGLLSIGSRSCRDAKCKYIYLPSSLTMLHQYAILCNPNLIEIVSEQSSVCSINSNALLSYDKTLFYTFPAQITGTYYIPNTVKVIGHDAFCYSKLQEIIVPESCTEIAKTPFFYMDNLAFLRIPKSVVKILNNSITECPNLRNLTIEMESIPCLDYQSVEIITLGNETKVIEDNALKTAAKLQSIIIPPSVTKIGVEAFKGLKNLKIVRIYRQPTIGASAFMDTRISCGVDCHSTLVDPLILSGVNIKSFGYCCIASVVQNTELIKSLFKIEFLIFILV